MLIAVVGTEIRTGGEKKIVELPAPPLEVLLGKKIHIQLFNNKILNITIVTRKECFDEE